MVKSKGETERQMGKGKRHADGQGGRQDEDEAVDSVAEMLLSQHGACRPAGWELRLSSLLSLSLVSLSFFSHFLSLFISFCILLPAPFCCFYLLYFLSTELQSSLLSFTPVSFCFLHSSHLLTNTQQLAIAAAEEVQPCVPDQSST